MPNIGSILKLVLRHAPDIFVATQKMRSVKPQPVATEAQEDLQALGKKLTARMEDLEQVNERLRTRIKDLESHIVFLSTLMYVGGGFLALMVIVALIVALTR